MTMGNEHMINNNIDWKKGIIYQGNQQRIKELMARCKKGHSLTIGFLGGSITQGSLSSKPELCYAYRTFLWWKKTFPKSKFTYVNAGIGGTTSHFGIARVEDDLLAYEPDFVIVEFSVNDENTEHFQETYEGLLRKIYQSESKPAMLIVHNIYYDTGKSAQKIHEQLGRHYQIPCVSVQPTIYEKVLSGTIKKSDITPDSLHPNDLGHELLTMQITYFLQQIWEDNTIITEKSFFPSALTKNRYEKAYRLQNRNSEPVLNGFVLDMSKPNEITDCFKKGWMANYPGAKITFSVTAKTIAIQYRRTINKPAPIAEVVVDGIVVTQLNANFDEDWGDKLELCTVLEDMVEQKHTIEIRIIDAAQNVASPFYLTALVVS